jgi:hypothetical protein
MKFADEDGNIDVDRIEKENPKLLEMIGYRIPTESKYSMVPLKIVGFLPRNSGEGIMLPNEITTMSGSDFDIDKLYIMRYAYNISDNGRCYTPKDERSLRNNDIIDISYSILTSEYVLEQLFTPGNFDSLKQLGYSIQAAKTTKDGLYASMFDKCMNTDDIDQVKQMGYQ